MTDARTLQRQLATLQQSNAELLQRALNAEQISQYLDVFEAGRTAYPGMPELDSGVRLVLALRGGKVLDLLGVENGAYLVLSNKGPLSGTTDRYERLVALKNQYDPGNLFRLNQNIPPD